MDESTHNAVDDAPDTGSIEVAPRRSIDEPVPNRSKVGWIAAAIVVASALVFTQLLVLVSLSSARDEIDDLNAQLASVDSSVSALSVDVAEVAEDVQAVESQAVQGGGSSAIEPPNQSAPAGFLPRFERGTADRAIGMTMGAIEGIDGYAESATSIDPADGIRRVWMIWAHWCPFCQEELPELNAWYPTVEDSFDAELVTVSTSIDPNRGNPLPAYLDTEQFSFPVVVDADNQMAVKMGVSAFPFWIVTDGNGEVLLRTAGLLNPDQVNGLFEQLDDLES